MDNNQQNQNNWPTPNNFGGQGMNNVPPWVWSILSMAAAANGNNGMNNGQNNQQTNQPTNQQSPLGSVTNHLPGKTIDTQEDIRPQDIPNDGAIAYFPTRDQHEIYARFWDKDCNLQMIKYMQEPSKMEDQRSDPFDQLNERLAKIEELLSHRNYQNRPPQKNNNNQKGGTEHE